MCYNGLYKIVHVTDPRCLRSTIGYGDVQPQSTLERYYVIGCMVVGASIYAYMVGAVCGIVASMCVPHHVMLRPTTLVSFPLTLYTLVESLN